MSIIAPIHPKIDTKRLTEGSATAIPYMVKLKCDCAAMQSLSVRCPRGVTAVPPTRHLSDNAKTNRPTPRCRPRRYQISATTSKKALQARNLYNIREIQHRSTAAGLSSISTRHILSVRQRTGTIKHNTWHKNH